MIKGFFQRVRGDRRGVSAVEFALIAPVLIASYFGLAVLCSAMLAERKASHVASAIGDLYAQATTIHDSDMTDMFMIANAVMAPYDTSAASLQMRVTEVIKDSLGNATVQASDGKNMSALVKGAPYNSLPIGLIGPNQCIVVAEATYNYDSPFHAQGGVLSFLSNSYPFTEKFYLQPRQSDCVLRISP